MELVRQKAGTDNRLQLTYLIRPFALDLEPATEMRPAGAEAEFIRRAAVFGFVNVIVSLVEESRAIERRGFGIGRAAT